jgi:hypothetical protein
MSNAPEAFDRTVHLFLVDTASGGEIITGYLGGPTTIGGRRKSAASGGNA